MRIKIQDYGFDQLIEQTCTLIGVLDSNWNLEKVNDPWTSILKFEESELVGKNFRAILHNPQDLDVLKEGLYHSKKIQGEVIHLLSKDGDPRWIKCNIGYDKEQILFLGIDVSEDVYTAQTLNHVSDIALIAAWRHNPKLNTVSWSQELHKILEVPEDTEFGFHTFKEFIHPAYINQFVDASKRLYNEKIGFNITIKMVSAKDQIKWVQIITYPNVVENEIKEVQGILKDVTNIQSALIEVSELKDTMEMALKGMQSGYFVHNLSTDKVSYSQSFRDLIGIKDHIKESDFRKLIHPDDAEVAYQRHIKRLKAKGNQYFNFYRVKTPNNTYRHYEVHGWRIRDESDKVIKLVGNLIDVDVRVRSEKKVKTYFNQMKTMLDNGKMSSFLLDKKGKILMADKNAQRIILKEYGIDIGAQSINFFDVVPFEEKKNFKIDFEHLKTGETIQKELSHTGIDGKTRWFEAIYIPVKNENNIVEGFVMDYFNITKRKNLLNELTFTKNKLQELNRLKNNIISNINHEIRTPLNGIMGAAELLNSTTSKKEQIELLEMQKESGARLLDTVNTIINYSLLDAQKQSFKISEVHLNGLISNCFDRFKKFADLNNVNYNLVDFKKSVYIISEPLMLQQCIGNVIHNAIKFSRNGKVEVVCLMANEVISVIVKDNGVGIEKHNHQRIFNNFEQESAGLNRDFEGTGMGLSFTKKFLEGIGGSIQLESKKGKGSVFTLNIPFDS